VQWGYQGGETLQEWANNYVFWRKNKQTNKKKKNGAQFVLFFFPCDFGIEGPFSSVFFLSWGLDLGARDFFGLKSGSGVEKHQVGIE